MKNISSEKYHFLENFKFRGYGGAVKFSQKKKKYIWVSPHHKYNHLRGVKTNVFSFTPP